MTGLPRVGSTLVYQALVRAFALSYVCKAVSSIDEAPAYSTRLLHRTLGISPPDLFDSHYGEVASWNAPSQCREVWGRWFPMDQSYVGSGCTAGWALSEIRAMVAAVENTFGMPFINKAQGHAVRIRPLCEAFPEAVFVRVIRQPLQVAESILLGRRECFGSDDHWFSAKPSSFASLAGLAPSEQIAGQIAGINEDMDRDLAVVGAERVFTLDYEDFCRDPQKISLEFAEFYVAQTSVSLTPRFELPTRFHASSRIRVPIEDSDALLLAMTKMGVPE